MAQKNLNYHVMPSKGLAEMIQTAWFTLKEIITFSTRQMKTVWMEVSQSMGVIMQRRIFKHMSCHATAVSPDSK